MREPPIGPVVTRLGVAVRDSCALMATLLDFARFPLERNRSSDKKERQTQYAGANSDRKSLATFAEFALSVRDRGRRRDRRRVRSLGVPSAGTTRIRFEGCFSATTAAPLAKPNKICRCNRIQIKLHLAICVAYLLLPECHTLAKLHSKRAQALRKRRHEE